MTKFFLLASTVAVLLFSGCAGFEDEPEVDRPAAAAAPDPMGHIPQPRTPDPLGNNNRGY